MSENLQSTTNGWIKNKWWDGFWILSGLWLIIPYIFQLQRPDKLYIIPLLIIALFWMGHRWGTVFIPYCLSEYGDLIQTQKARFIYLPLIVFLSTITLMFIPESILSFDIYSRLIFLAVIRVYGDLWHFSLQHYGIISLYRIRMGQSTGSNFKRIEKAYCYYVTIGMGLIAMFCNGTSLPFLPSGWASFFIGNKIYFQWVGGLISAVFITYIVFEEVKNPRRSIPKIIYIISIGMLGMVALFGHPLLMWFMFSGQHFLVACGLIIQIVGNSSNEKKPNLWYAFWAPFCRNQYTILALLIMVSLSMAVIFSSIDWSWGDDIRKVFSFSFIPHLVQGNLFKLLISFGYAYSFSHYMWDRAVYRMSDKKVREVSLPLLLGHKLKR